MSPQPVIGVDAGGTKLLAGVVHEDLTVGHCVRRLWSGGDRAEVLDVMVEAVGQALAVAGDASAVGFGIPSLVEYASGRSMSSVHLPLDDVPFRDLMTSGSGCPCTSTTIRTWPRSRSSGWARHAARRTW
jgi:glucokinase